MYPAILINLATLAQSVPPDALPPSWIKEFPFSVGLLIVIVLLLWWFIKSSEKRFEKRDEELKTYNEAREKNIMHINEIREKAYSELANTLKELVRRQGEDWRETSNRIDRNYQDAINKFVAVIKEQGDQNNYAIQILTELKGKIEEHSKSHHTTIGELTQMKKDINEALSKVASEYNLIKKETN